MSSSDLITLEEMSKIRDRKKLLFDRLDDFYQRLSENERPVGLHHFFEIENTFRKLCELIYINEPSISSILEEDDISKILDGIDDQESDESVDKSVRFINELKRSYPWLETEFRKFILETEANHLNPYTDADVSGRISHEARLPFIEETIYSGQTTLYTTRLPLDKYYRECSRKIERSRWFLEGLREDEIELNESFIEDFKEIFQSISENQQEIGKLLEELEEI